MFWVDNIRRKGQVGLKDRSEIIINEIVAKEERSGIPVRLGCGSIIIFTILCSVLVLLVINLVVGGEINIRRGDLGGYRIWLVRQDGLKGVGYSWTTELDENAEPGTTCVETKVRFLEWQTGQENGNIEYCECYVAQQGEWIFSGECRP